MKQKRTPAEELKSKAKGKTISTSSSNPETLYETRKKLSGANDKTIVLNEDAVRSFAAHSIVPNGASSQSVEASLKAASMTKMVAPTKDIAEEETNIPSKKAFANAQGYSYKGGSYGNFINNGHDSSSNTMAMGDIDALRAALIIQAETSNNTTGNEKPKAQYVANSSSYSYYGGSYGRFVSDADAMEAAAILDSKPKKEPESVTTALVEEKEEKEEKGLLYYVKKYKLLVIAAVFTVVYVVLRKKKMV